MNISRVIEGDHQLFGGTVKKVSDGSAVDITGYTITFRYSIDGGPFVSDTATISDATNGVVQYRFTSGIPDSGLMEYEWVINDGTYDSTGRDVDRSRFMVYVDERV